MESSTDTRVPPPSWINHDFMQSALKNAVRKKITIDSMNVQYANAEGLGYASLMFRLTVFLRYEDNEETQKKTLIVKTLLQSGRLKDILEKLDIFKTETEMLHDMMPQIHEILSALEKEEFRPLAAKCYQWGRQPVTFLVLEDLSAVGFKLAQAGQPLNLKHCAVVLRAYARLHAASVYVLSKQPHYKDKYSLNMFTDETSLQHLASLATKYINGLANELEKCPGYEQYSERYRTFANRFIDVTYERMEKIKKQTKLPVLTHGDCWKNNMMFKYMDEEVSEVRLVDFQCSSVTSPASDLLYFLYSSASEDVHRHHMEDLLREYHSTLVGLLRRLGLEQQAEAYTFEELKKDMDHCLVIAVFLSSLSGMVLTSEKHGAEYAKAFKDQENLDNAVYKSFRNPYTLSYLKYLAPLFVNKGIL
ncbi:uncharacterized protein LOC126455615 [Schistocerca serialis cubense]|uniref:uncharacterized protein LOC126455615 n=1 Tax=Schistocerca serialis cubense TaxID=2023355 RepID=UPI00214EA318|nr:uncharacterized protein LOC126455615 [Schistocerca serialis cubense]